MKPVYNFSLLLLLLLLSACGKQQRPFSHSVYVGESDDVIEAAVRVVPNEKQIHSLENGFSAFVHFGPNTFTGREWGSGTEDPSVFALDSAYTDQWCSIIAAAGMKRVILTAKHHDGFVLWPSRYTDHGVASSPFRGDIVRQVSASCQKYGLEFGFYLSPADLYQMEEPDGLYGNGSEATLRRIPREVPGRPFADSRHFEAVVDDYNEYFMNQLFELLTEYGPVSEVWFDGAHPRHKGGQQYNYLAWKEMIHTLAPDAIIFGKEDLRWCGNEAGETRPSEWNVIPFAEDPSTLQMFGDLTEEDLASRERLESLPRPLWLLYQPAETDVSIRDGWFWRNDDEQAVRSADDLLDIWERSVGGNSILLLNVPPNVDGRISPRDSLSLVTLGQRLRETYGTDLLSGARCEQSSDGVEWTLPAPALINRVSLFEDIRQGERVESFVLEVWDGASWTELSRGTNIGYRRILRFTGIRTDRLRLRILSSRAKPCHVRATAHFDASSSAVEPEKTSRLE